MSEHFNTKRDRGLKVKSLDGGASRRGRRRFSGKSLLKPIASPRQEHLNRSLSKVEKGCSTAAVKWRLRVTFKFTMTNGARWGSADAIIIRRLDVEHVEAYARAHCDLRDYLMIRLPKKIGLRTREIATLEKEDIDFETRSFRVLDSKKHRFYPLPLDVLTLQLIKDLTSGFEGLVFRHKTYKRNKGKPLTNVSIWKTVRVIGERAGVKGFHPRILRHYFAATMIYPEPDEHGNRPQPASVETLRRILRHANLTVTHRYLARLVFFEDIQRDYDRTQNPYVAQVEDYRQIKQVEFSDKNRFYEEFCSKCEREPTCKFLEKMSSCQACSGCRFYKPKKEMII